MKSIYFVNFAAAVILPIVLLSVYGLYSKLVDLRRKSTIVLVNQIRRRNRPLKHIKIVNRFFKGINLYRDMKNIVETVSTASFLFRLLYKKTIK